MLQQNSFYRHKDKGYGCKILADTGDGKYLCRISALNPDTRQIEFTYPVLRKQYILENYKV